MQINPTILRLAQLRLIVGYLGERSQFAWWPTAFYESTSRPFLEPVFAKTFRLVQYHGASEAARHLHDEHLNSGSYHLFRLPEEIEQDIHAYVQGLEGEKLVGEITASQEVALDKLKTLVEINSKTAEGPLLIGKITAIDSIDAQRLIAGSYFSAFSQNIRAYPYLVS